MRVSSPPPPNSPFSASRVQPDEKLLLHLKNRFNYASSSCSARVLACNPEVTGPAALLAPSKDTYLLYTCALPQKFLVVELCEPVKIDTVLLANYELFSSTMKGFKVYAAMDEFTGEQVLWKLVLDAEMSDKLVTREQAFPVISGGFVKYLRIEFDDQVYGHERLCPLSALKVYGKTMLDEFKEEMQSGSSANKIGTTSKNPLSQSREIVLAATSQSHENLLEKMSSLASELTQLQSFNNFSMRTRSLTAECLESEQLIQDLKDEYAQLEAQTARISADKQQVNGNVFKQLHERLSALEVSLKEHPINLILFRSRRTDDNENNADFPKLSGSSVKSEFNVDGLFSDFKNDIKSLRSDLYNLQSAVSLQQTKITLLIIVNVLLLILFAIRTFKRRDLPPAPKPTSSTLELKRRPLLELKSSSSSSKSKSKSVCSLSNNPGVLLSDDEVLHLINDDSEKDDSE